MRLLNINFILLIAYLVFSACEITYPPESDSVTPVISSLIIADTLYLDSSIAYPVKVTVEDPQGSDDIRRVDMSISNINTSEILYRDTLQDNGSDGDIIPADGQYFTVIDSSFTETGGLFQVQIQAEDLSGNDALPVSDTLIVQEGEVNLAPVISDPVMPYSLDSTSIQDVFISIKADDPQGLTDIDSVFLWLYPPLQPAPVFKNKLRDDGTKGDSAAGDGIFSLRKDLSLVLGSSGINLVRFQAVDKRGELSNSLVREIDVTLPNAPPRLSDLSAPDTLRRSISQSSLLSVKVTDPQGAGDIDIVFFDSFLPDGSASQGNPHRMYDNGEFGDVTPDDTIYSLGINVTPSVDLGKYRFEFIARDNSKAMSDTLIHIITIVE